MKSAFGGSTLYDCTTGNNNICMGWVAGRFITTGAYNTLIGGHAPGYAITTDNNNICIGNNAH